MNLRDKHFILVLDESGQTSIRDPCGARHSFIEGGFIVPSDHADSLCKHLRAFRDAFLDESATEVKSHQLAQAMGGFGSVADFEHALAHVSIAFRDCEATLAGVFLDKAEFFGLPVGFYTLPASERRGRANRKGGKRPGGQQRGKLRGASPEGQRTRINQQHLFGMLAVNFDNFLQQKGARGVIVHDEVHSERVHDNWRAAFSKMKIRHIDSLSFVDSKSSDLVQMADTAIGLIRSHFDKKVILRDGALAMAQGAQDAGLLIRATP